MTALLLKDRGWKQGHFTATGDDYWEHQRTGADRHSFSSALACELASETRRADSAEAELRETVGELERVTGLARATAEALDKALVKCTDRGTRLTEATALLEEAKVIATCEVDWQDTVQPWLDRYDAFLSRTPSPPIALPTEGATPCATCHATPISPGDHYSWCNSWRSEPAAPEPVSPCRCSGSFTSPCDWCLEQPSAPEPVRAPNPEAVARILADPDPDCAAPEPSADTRQIEHWQAAEREARHWRDKFYEWADAARDVGVSCPGAMQQAKHMADAAVAALNKVGSGLSYEDTSPQDITDGILLRCNGNPVNCDVAHDFAERANGLLESAEAQLAAVREALDELPIGNRLHSWNNPCRAVGGPDKFWASLDKVRAAAAITPAPSPGAGEKT
jgi:hypothetical protein